MSLISNTYIFSSSTIEYLWDNLGCTAKLKQILNIYHNRNSLSNMDYKLNDFKNRFNTNLENDSLPYIVMVDNKDKKIESFDVSVTNDIILLEKERIFYKHFPIEVLQHDDEQDFWSNLTSPYTDGKTEVKKIDNDLREIIGMNRSQLRSFTCIRIDK